MPVSLRGRCCGFGSRAFGACYQVGFLGYNFKIQLPLRIPASARRLEWKVCEPEALHGNCTESERPVIAWLSCRVFSRAFLDGMANCSRISLALPKVA